MKKISEDEFRDYLEFKKFMGEEPGSLRKKKPEGALSMEDLDMVRAARGDQDFARFMSEMKARKEREDR